MFVLCYLYTETVAGLRVAVLLAEENKTEWAPTIGYFVVLELRVALSLAKPSQPSQSSNWGRRLAQSASRRPPVC